MCFRHISVRLLFVLCLLISNVFAAGCGGDEDLCAEDDCVFGVCDPADGQCVNPDTCEGDDECLVGYGCDEGQCQADTCEGDGDCETGVCSEGICQNPSSCTHNDDCLPRTYCGSDGECVADPCNEVDCERGVCERGTEECVGAETCTAQTEQQDCLDGQRCADGTCVAQEDVCEELDCQRGVCDEDAAACVDPETCTETSDCTEGNYCNDAGECEVNVCDDEGIDCPRGVCDATSGECVDPETCSTSEDCLDGSVCVQDDGPRDLTCRPRADACMEGGCPGTQLCDLDEDAQTAECIEDDEVDCTSALDCVGDRICNGRECTEPTACEDDALEPNDTAEDAVDLQQSGYVRQGGVAASICDGDTDVFTYDLSQAGLDRGTFTVRLNMHPRHIGNGELEVTVHDSEGDLVDEGQVDDEGKLALDMSIGVLDEADVYTIRVAGVGEVGTHGVDYELSARYVEDYVLARCDDVTPLQFGVTTENDTTDADTAQFGSSCASDPTATTENIYAIEVDEPSEVTIEAEALDDADIALSLRESCFRDDSELACRDRQFYDAQDGSDNDPDLERIVEMLSPGTYFIMVEGAAAGEGGAYELRAEAVSSACGPAENYCGEAGESRVCTGPAGFEREVCSEGCDPDNGRCFREPGATCETAVARDASFTETIDFGELSDNMELGAVSCLSGADGQIPTDGPDKVYAIALRPDHGMTAKLDMAEDERGAMYLLSGCADATSSCTSGVEVDGSAAADNDPLTYLNDSSHSETVFLVVDAPGEQELTTAELDVHIGETTCSPRESRCVDDRREECNDIGTFFVEDRTCNFGCEQGACNAPTNDSCEDPLALSANTTVNQLIDPYADDYDTGEYGCVDGESPGKDAVYEVTTTEDDKVVTVDVQADFDAAVYTLDYCGDASAACSQGADAAAAGETERLSFYAPTAGDYLVVVDSKDSSANGFFEISATIGDPECNPSDTPTCDTSQSGTLSYCSQAGTDEQYACPSGTCTDGACEDAGGDECLDAIAVSDGDTVTGDFSGTDTFNTGRGQTGQCIFGNRDGTEGEDTFYRIDLAAGDLLEAQLDTSVDEARLFFLENCDAANSCFGGQPEEGSQTKYYHSEDGGPVYVAVDRADDGSESGDFDLSFSVTSGRTCSPEASRCKDDSTVQVCNLAGTAWADEYDCPDSCTAGACDSGAPSADTCATAPDIGNGAVIRGNFDQFNADVEVDETSCLPYGNSASGSDAVYQVQLNEGSVLQASLVTPAHEPPHLYLIEDCAAANDTCAAAAWEEQDDGAHLTYVADQTETLFLVADTNTSDGDFELSVDIRDPECSPGTSTCAADGATLQYCTSNGVYENTACSSGTCSNGSCDSPDNDLCLEAESISDGDTVTGTWTGTNDRFIDEGRHGQCIFPDYEHPEGPDTFYRIDLQSGDLLSATLDSDDSQALLYFLEDCTNSDTCVGGGFEAADQTQQYYADSDGPVTIAVSRGSSSTNSESFDLTVDVQSSMTCRPGESTCIDSGTVGQCNDSGDGYDAQYSCHAGCNLGACDADAANADTCYNAPLLSGSTYIIGEYAGLNNAVSIDADSCTGAEDGGGDAVYRVDVDAGEVLEATVTSYEEEGPMVYIVEDCSDTEGTCLDGDARTYSDDGDTARAAFASDTDQTVYVVVDSTNNSPEGPFSLEVEIGSPQCSVGDRRCSPDDSSVVEYCEESLTYATYECTGSCTNGTCDNPTGDECIDAIPLAPGESFTGSYSDMSESLNPGVGTCIHSPENEMRGRDAVFAMDLTQGQVVRATLERSSEYGSPGDGAGMYVLENCAGDERDTCLWAEPQSDELEFHADQDGTYYLVADYDQYGYDDFTLSLEEVTTGAVCQPGETSCDPATGELSLCDTTGSSVRSTGTCTDGCEGTQCAAPTTPNTTCADAYKLDGSTRLVDTYDRFTEDLSLDSCGVTSSDTSGPDAVYEVDLQAGEAVDASVNVMTEYSGDPTVYIVTDCTDTDATCLAGEVGSEKKARVGYEASSAETVYIVVDTDSSYNTYYYELDVNVVSAECSAGDATCADDDTLLSCSDYGVYQPNECSFGCANDACQPPPNDDCSGAIDVPVDSTTYRFSSTIGSYGDDYDLGDGTAGSCVLSASGYEVDTPGQDAVYKVNASVGTIITAEFVPDFDQSYGPDGILWVSEECPSLVDGCSAGAAPGYTDDSTELTFIAPEAKTYYIVADVDDTGATGSFHVDISAESRSCIPGTTASCDGDDLEYCNDLGTGYDSYTCAGGCNVAGSSPSCGDPAGEICADALDASGGGTFTVDMSTMDNDFDLNPGGCTPTSTSAKDVVLEIPVQDGEYVEATATPTASGDDPMLYFLSDCSSAATDNPACAGASDSAGDDQPETVGHKAQETGSLFLVVDGRYTSDLSGNVDIDVTISPELCTPGEVLGCDDSSTLRYCNNLGTAEETYTCSGQCDASSGTAECTQPTGDICPDAIDATGGGTFTVDMSTMSNEYDMKGLSCTGEPMPAGDAVYRMDVTAGDQITIDATPGSNDDPALYILDDCTAGSNSSSRTCLAGSSEGYGGQAETLVYDVVEDGTIFVVADADEVAEAVETWTVDITVN